MHMKCEKEFKIVKHNKFIEINVRLVGYKLSNNFIKFIF